HGDLREAVHRGVEREEALQDAGHEKHATTRKLILVELQLDAPSAGEGEALLGRNAGVGRRAADPDEPLDLALAAGGAARVVQPENLAQRLPPVLDEREVVERERGHQPPEQRPAEWRLNDARRLDEADHAPHGATLRELEITPFLDAERQAARQVS